MSSFECRNSVFKINNENNSFSITTPGHWGSKPAEQSIIELIKLLEFRSLELHVKEVRKRGNEIEKRDNEYKLSEFDTQKKTRDSKNKKK